VEKRKILNIGNGQIWIKIQNSDTNIMVYGCGEENMPKFGIKIRSVLLRNIKQLFR
jgi:hypothetical protein